MRTLPENITTAAQASAKATEVPASVTLAQYILETGWGAHMPLNSNNPFGIKALKGQPEVICETNEYVHGKMVKMNQAFRKFSSIEEAFMAHGDLIAHGRNYASAMAFKDQPEEFAQQLQKDGYATDPNYGNSLVKLMQLNQLEKFDVGKEVPPNGSSPAK